MGGFQLAQSESGEKILRDVWLDKPTVLYARVYHLDFGHRDFPLILAFILPEHLHNCKFLLSRVSRNIVIEHPEIGVLYMRYRDKRRQATACPIHSGNGGRQVFPLPPFHLSQMHGGASPRSHGRSIQYIKTLIPDVRRLQTEAFVIILWGYFNYF